MILFSCRNGWLVIILKDSSKVTMTLYVTLRTIQGVLHDNWDTCLPLNHFFVLFFCFPNQWPRKRIAWQPWYIFAATLPIVLTAFLFFLIKFFHSTNRYAGHIKTIYFYLTDIPVIAA